MGGDVQDFVWPIFSFQTWLTCRILHVPAFHFRPVWCAGFCMSQLFISDLADMQDFACPIFSFQTCLVCRILHVPAFHFRLATICHFAWGRQTKSEDYFLELFSKMGYKTATPFPWHHNFVYEWLEKHFAGRQVELYLSLMNIHSTAWHYCQKLCLISVVISFSS